MSRVEVAKAFESSEERVKREGESIQTWRSMEETEREVLIDTVHSELRRLADTIPNWLPASIKNSGTMCQIVITLQQPHPNAPVVHFPTDEEIADKAARLHDSLQSIVDI